MSNIIYDYFNKDYFLVGIVFDSFEDGSEEHNNRYQKKI